MRLFFDYNTKTTSMVSIHDEWGYINKHYYTVLSGISSKFLESHKKHLTSCLLETDGIVFDKKYLSGSVATTVRTSTFDYIDVTYTNISGMTISKSVSVNFIRKKNILVIGHITVDKTTTTLTGYYIEPSILAVAQRNMMIDDFLLDLP